ncbi:putative Histidine kinase [Candidatus Terasakiella magnetica]|uniref:histidine kinase n=1 Tax=Candidatus Terasakiella magnetica TaxID=1867952 RepID=A0A1C3RFD9_9PROT|nr:PAS domain S-box protein [Candidatus Terasakiella magnetica]SCA56000.1 putative Histidine kinase [Candidatus Terasakiella magnetica]
MKLTTKTIYLLINIMVLVVLFSVGLVFLLWYDKEFEHERARLIEIVQSRSEMIGAVAKYDQIEGKKLGKSNAQSQQDTLKQIREAHSRFKGFGQTGEFTLGKIVNGQIVFLLRHRHQEKDHKHQMVFSTSEAQPMRAALKKQSGIMEGYDYRGQKVLAAYEYIDAMDMGIVAKVDLEELHEPFKKAAIQISLMSFLTILAGAFFFQKTSAPLIRVIERNEELLTRVLEASDDIVLSTGLNNSITYINNAGARIFKESKDNIIGKPLDDFLSKKALIQFNTSQRILDETGKGHSFVCALDPNLSTRLFHTHQTTIKAEKGFLTGTVCIARDVTETLETQRLFTENKALTDTIVNNAADGIILLNNQGHICIWNKAAQRIFGYEENEVLGKNPHSFLAFPEDQIAGSNALANFLKTGQLNTLHDVVELKARCKNENVIDIELSLAGLSQDNGWHALGIFRDVTHKKQQEQALQRVYNQLAESASNYKYLFDNAKISIWDEDFTDVYDALEALKEQGIRDIKVYLNANPEVALNLAQKIKINDINEETLRLYRAQSKEHFFNSITETFSGDALDIFIDEIDAIWHKKSGFVTSTTQRTLDGKSIYVMIYVPIPTEREEYKNIPVSILDITETVLTKERLNEQNEALQELQNIIDRSPAVAFLWRNEEKWPVEYVSHNISEWGYTKEQFESGQLHFVDIVNPDDLERVGNEVSQYIENDYSSFVQEYRIIAADGSIHWIDDRTWVRKDHEGNITHFEGICLEITERKEVERLLWQSQKSEALGNMAAGIAHDFNNMLLPVIALTDLTANQCKDDDPIKRRMLKIKDAGEKAQELVKSLMIFAREEEVEFNPIHVCDFLSTTIELLEQTMPSSMQIIQKGGCPKEYQDCSILGSFGQLQSVLINIAKNAADALNGRTGTFNIECSQLLNDNSHTDVELPEQGAVYFHIRLKDNGPGMTDEVLMRIFDPFYTTKAVGEGTGMGLAMARSIIDKHKGLIRAHSRKGYGTTFDIYIPLIVS